MVLKNPYDLVLMDIQMPEMDGLQASMTIRQSSELEKLPIIAMTVHAMSGDQEKSLSAGMNDHITKPVDPNELAATLSKWIKPRIRVANARNTRPKPAASQSGNDETELPANLPGTDLDIGIQRLDGNKRLLKKLLMEFHEDYRTTPNTLKSALAQGNLEAVRHIAHTIKGVAGNLGAIKLQHAAAELENIDNSDSDNLRLLRQFERCFNPLIHSLQEFREHQQANTAGKTAISPPNPVALTEASDIKPDFVELHDMLRHGRADSIACLSRLKQVLAESSMQESLSRLEQQIGAYDFDDVILTLTELARNFGIDLAEK